MILPPLRHAEPRPRQRRLLAMAATILFAFCVLIASAPHRHGEAIVRTGRHGSQPAIVAAANATPTDCALCDWLYSPTLPADVPPAIVIIAPVVRLVLPPAIRLRGTAAAAPAQSSSRAPPAVFAA